MKPLQLTIEFADDLELTLKNTGSQRVALWEQSNSWGWPVYQIGIELSNGLYQLTRLPKIFTRNGPGYFLLEGDEEKKVDLQLNRRNWDVSQIGNPANFSSCNVQVVMTIPATAEALELGVLAGHFSSNSLTLTAGQTKKFFEQLHS